MPKVLGPAASNKWALCYSDDRTVIHKVFIQAGQHCDTGQPNFELFTSEEDADARIAELEAV